MSCSHTTATTRTSSKFILLILAIAAIVRLVLTLKLPLNLIHIAGHDDGLFIRLAISIGSAKWLGSFDQFTLMKGPGYPAFIAVSSISGIPLSGAHALFQIGSVAVTAWAVFRLTRSRMFAVLTFLLLTFYPVAFVPEMQRVLRDQIYWGQTLLVFSVFSVLVLAPPGRPVGRLVLAACAGGILGWAWLTREEGVWFLPGLCILVVGAAVVAGRSRSRLLSLGQSSIVAITAFLVVNVAFLTGNRIAYGSFVGVDIKESNFVSALGALQRIDSGPVRPFIPVPLAALSQAAKVSATFAPLAAALAPGMPLAQWTVPGCQVYPTTCGEFAGGWFIWAFRDAAAASGFYRSPKEASKRFGQIASEVSAACADGRLQCRRNWFGLLPPMSAEQWWSLPRSFGALAAKISFLSLPGDGDTPPSPIYVAREMFHRYWAYLNYPAVSPSTGASFVLRGWYDDARSVEWPSFKAYSQNGAELPFVEARRLPNVNPSTSDERITRNRLEISFVCPDSCAVAVIRRDAPEIRLSLDGGAMMDASEGTAKLHFGSVEKEPILHALGESVAVRARTALLRFYGVLVPLLVGSGLLATIIGIVRNVRMRVLQPLLLVSLAAWALIGTRIVLLGLIEASAFPAINFSYAAPALYLAAIASLFSIAALMARIRHQQFSWADDTRT